MRRSSTAGIPAEARHLRALPGGRREPPSSGGLVRATQRPGDRHDACPIDALRGPALEEIRSQAAYERVPLDLAVSLVVQQLLAASDLRDVFGDDAPRLIAELDRMATTAQVHRAVSPAYAAYVRELTSVRATRPQATTTTVPLPVRVIERLSRALPVPEEAEIDVAAAVAWERASALGGQTMAEWAALSAAGLSRT